MSTLPTTPRPRHAAPAAEPPAGRAGDAIGRGSAHAKAILLGEHAVVYGAPAIAFPLDALEARAMTRLGGGAIRIDSALFQGEAGDAPARLAPIATAIDAALARFELRATGAEVRIDSDIPAGRGLGSSAAVAAAVARSVADAAGLELDAATCFELVQLAERVAHVNPSGLDARAVVADGPIRFVRPAGRLALRAERDEHLGDYRSTGAIPVLAPRVRELAVGAELLFVIGDTGVHGSTAEAVGLVRSARESRPDRIDGILDELGELAAGATDDLAAGDRDALGERLGVAHALLGALGVSSPGLDALASAAESAGALGAKLTGGGLGGCAIALAPDADAATRIESAMVAAGARRAWTATMGVR